MKIITQKICPPIPIRCYDWIAWYDGREDGVTGHGDTEIAAIYDLGDQDDDEPFDYNHDERFAM